MALRPLAKAGLSAVMVCVGGWMVSPQQAQRGSGQAYTVQVIPCGEFGKPACGTVVTIPAGATGESLMAMTTPAVNAGRTWEAMVYIEEAAGMGYAKAEAALGADYGFGLGVPLDLVKGRYWLQKAADQGDSAAQGEVGEFYQLAEGGPPDMAKAIHYFELAAAQGNPRAERDLGFAYELGMGVAHDRAKAIALLRRAAAGNRRLGLSPARPEAYANALSRAGSRRFASSEELATFVYPPPRQTQAQTQRPNVPNGCPQIMNYTLSPGGYGGKARFCSYHPGCPVQLGGLQQTCPAYTGASLYQIYHDN